MATGNELFLHEEIMLLALRDEKGTMMASEKLHFSLGGAIAAELLLNQRIAVDEQKKKSDVSVREIKKKIQELKTLKAQAHEDKDKTKADILRRRISRLKKKTRRAA